MARRRDYKAEYAARQARARAEFGTSYGKARRIRERAERQEISRSKVYDTLRDLKAAGKSPIKFAKMLVEREQSRRDYRNGIDVEWDVSEYEDLDIDDEFLYYH